MLQNLAIIQVYAPGASTQACRAVRFAAGISCRLGASSVVSGTRPNLNGFGFYDLDDTFIDDHQLVEHISELQGLGKRVILLRAGEPGDIAQMPVSHVSCISVELEPWQNEVSLFAGAGLAHLLGDPERAPLVSSASYAAHTIGYATFAAISAVDASLNRFGKIESAVVNGEAAFSWINWKAAVVGELGETLTRQGDLAEWPILPCKDGDVAFVYTERDWKTIIALVGDPSLEDPRFATFKGRSEFREECMAPIRAWCLEKTKAELISLFSEYALPCSPVLTITDLMQDDLLSHRAAFEKTQSGQTLPVLPHRIEAEGPSGAAKSDAEGELPLSGIRVLDFGIITAGAGVSGLLADMGAEVIKIESETYPDPFRSWAGATDIESPFFKSNNRNKKGVALNLKTEQGLQDFLRLAKSADIVIENFRRGVLDRLGLTFERLRAQNPSILLASISGLGLTGPGSEATTFGSTLEASSGFAHLTCYEDRKPVISGRNLNYPDQTVCLYGAAIIAAQVVQCRQDGAARHIDVAQRDCAMYQAGDVFGYVSSGGNQDAEDVRRALHGDDQAAIARCADGTYAAVSSANASALDFIPDEAREWASGTLESNSSTSGASDAYTVVASRTGADLLSAPHNLQAGTFLRSPNGALVKGFPFQLINQPMKIWADSPQVGEHTDTILNASKDL